MFEDRLLRRIFGPKREEVVAGWRGLHYEELQNMYSSLNIMWLIKARRMRWAVLKHSGDTILVGKPE
jgi:hypothetical protein